MRNGPPERSQQAARALRSELSNADDEKILRITAMLDGVSDTTGKQAILDPLRARLGALRPVRPLRFVRLLFTPLDPLIVRASDWKSDRAAVPRTVLASIANVVRTGLGPEASLIDKIISGHASDDLQVIAVAGEALWPRAAEILAASSVPDDWSKTGLRVSLYSPIAQAIAAVLRRGPQLRCLLRDGEVAAIEADLRTIGEILQDIAGEPQQACAMIAELILLQSPHAAPLLRQFISSSSNTTQKARWKLAVAHGTEQALSKMEDTGMVDEIGRAPLSDVADNLRRMVTLLHEIGSDADMPGRRSRLKAIRDKLDQVCQARFAEGLREGLVLPLATASEQVDKAGQLQMEVCARDLRALETTMRKVAGSANYNDQLLRASQTVQAAAEAGTLTPIRKFRLIEILAGPEVATALYKKEAVMPSGETR